MGKTKRSGQKEDMSKHELQEVEKNQPQPRTRGASNRTTNKIRRQKTHRSPIAEKIYWLLTDQIIPSQHNFHNNVKEKHEQDWRKIDLSKLYIQACMESFQWRSAHGKLYAR
jgi:hypothetical protein